MINSSASYHFFITIIDTIEFVNSKFSGKLLYRWSDHSFFDIFSVTRRKTITPSSWYLSLLLYLQLSILYLQHKCAKYSYFPQHSFFFTACRLEWKKRFVYTARISLPRVTDEKDWINTPDAEHRGIKTCSKASVSEQGTLKYKRGRGADYDWKP